MKKTNKSYAILVDGQCERWYIDMMKKNENIRHTRIEPKLPQKKKLQELIDEIENLLSQEYDKVFWIVDFDTILKETRDAEASKKSIKPLQTFQNFHTKANKKYKDRLIIIVNNPCLEYWLLLHYQNTSKHFTTCEDAIRELKKYLPDYEKKRDYYIRKDIYSRLKPTLETAISNAKAIGRWDASKTYSQGTSEMYLLFEDDEISKAIFGDKKDELEKDKVNLEELENLIYLLKSLFEYYDAKAEETDNSPDLRFELMEKVESLIEKLEKLTNTNYD